MTKLKTLFLSLLLIELLFAYAPAFAQSPSPTYSGVEGTITSYLCNPTAGGSGVLYQCVNQIYKFAIVVASVMGVFFIVIAGYVYMSAEGNSESTTKAKDILTTTLTAIVILLAGYALLHTINPDLVEFHGNTLQPVNITAPTVGSIAPGTPVTSTYTIPNGAVADLTGSGCAFQTDTQKNEAPQMVPQLELIVKNICYNITQGNKYPGIAGQKPTISSIIGVGKHATNSYHYKGCAVDFAAGNANFVSSPMGQAIIQEAKNNGISASRINPGVDAGVQNMVHIDLGTGCPNNSNVDPNVIE